MSFVPFDLHSATLMDVAAREDDSRAPRLEANGRAFPFVDVALIDGDVVGSRSRVTNPDPWECNNAIWTSQNCQNGRSTVRTSASCARLQERIVGEDLDRQLPASPPDNLFPMEKGPS